LQAALPLLAVWLGVKHRQDKKPFFPSGCFMSGQKKRYFKVFSQFVPFPSRIVYFAHYYPIFTASKPSPSVCTLGDIVSVFQYASTAEEAAALMSSMFQYAHNKAFLSLPYNPAFNGGQGFLF
jgi:hypothetical protein